MGHKVPIGFIKTKSFLECRKEKDLKRASLAHYLNVDLGTISKLENTRYKGFNISVVVLLKYMKFFQKDWNFFINGELIELNK